MASISSSVNSLLRIIGTTFAKDVAVAVSAELDLARPRADVVADHDAVEVASVDEGANRGDPDPVTGQVQVPALDEPGVLPAEHVELQDASMVREAEDVVDREEPAVDVVHDRPRHVGACRLDELDDLERRRRVAPRMDREGRAGLPLGDDRSLDGPSLRFGPRPRAADLADDAGTDGALAVTVLDVVDDVGDEVVDAPPPDRIRP